MMLRVLAEDTDYPQENGRYITVDAKGKFVYVRYQGDDEDFIDIGGYVYVLPEYEDLESVIHETGPSGHGVKVEQWPLTVEDHEAETLYQLFIWSKPRKNGGEKVIRFDLVDVSEASGADAIKAILEEVKSFELHCGHVMCPVCHAPEEGGKIVPVMRFVEGQPVFEGEVKTGREETVEGFTYDCENCGNHFVIYLGHETFNAPKESRWMNADEEES